MNLQVTSEEQLVDIVRQHLKKGYNFRDCLELLGELTLLEYLGTLEEDDKALIAKLEAPSEYMASATEPDQPAAPLEAGAWPL